MPRLLIHQSTFFAPLDEEAFFRWLGSISGVRKITGTPDGLELSLRSASLSEAALRNLIALHWRYRLPMRDLRQFKADKNKSWFYDSSTYWFEAVFGENAVPASMEIRLADLRDNNSSPVEAIKIIRQEYAVSLGEAKRRLSLSPSWASLAAANLELQNEAIKITVGIGKASSRRAASEETPPRAK